MGRRSTTRGVQCVSRSFVAHAWLTASLGVRPVHRWHSLRLMRALPVRSDGLTCADLLGAAFRVCAIESTSFSFTHKSFEALRPPVTLCVSGTCEHGYLQTDRAGPFRQRPLQTAGHARNS